jgi:hypothetical protein
MGFQLYVVATSVEDQIHTLHFSPTSPVSHEMFEYGFSKKNNVIPDTVIHIVILIYMSCMFPFNRPDFYVFS